MITEEVLFAELDENNIIARVIVIDSQYETDGENWCNMFLGGTWKQTSYYTQGGINSQGKPPFRKNYAGIGYKYDSNRDAFIPPQPFASWLIDEEKGLWAAPKEYPQDGKEYVWNENSKKWDVDEE